MAPFTAADARGAGADRDDAIVIRWYTQSLDDHEAEDCCSR